MAKREKKKKKWYESEDRTTWADAILASPVGTVVTGVLAIVFGLVFIFLGNNTPVSREEALSYTGNFVEYEVAENWRTIHFEDGSTYNVYPHTEEQAFQDRMLALAKGTRLYLLINPNNEYVAEIRTDTEELLNFEASQAAVESYDNGYIAIGAVVVAGGVFLIVYGIHSSHYKKEERARRKKRVRRRGKGQDDVALRRSSPLVKSRTLLKITVGEYEICYRRVRSVNELVVNGLVYDEKKGIVEFSHRLNAVVDGHRIAAGYDDRDSYSYILFDGERVAEKKRWI